MNDCLVGGLEHGFYIFPHLLLGIIIIPTDELTRGWAASHGPHGAHGAHG